MTPQDAQTSPRTWRIFALPAAVALVAYVLLYSCDHWARTRQGPWEVTYIQETDGTPAVRIHQSALGIHAVTVRFEGERLPPETPARLPVTVRFDQPEAQVPFGSLAFHDLMYQPGTVVLHCFGHEVQMLPRALFLNRTETPWQPTALHRLNPAGKPPELVPADRWGRRRASADSRDAGQ